MRTLGGEVKMQSPLRRGRIKALPYEVKRTQMHNSPLAIRQFWNFYGRCTSIYAYSGEDKIKIKLK